MMIAFEKAIQKSMYDPELRRLKRCRLTLLRDHPLKPAFLQKPVTVTFES